MSYSFNFLNSLSRERINRVRGETGNSNEVISVNVP